jgi:hypothetical protein
MKKAAKRGRKLGVKVGPYKLTLSQIANRIRHIESRLTKLEKVLS